MFLAQLVAAAVTVGSLVYWLSGVLFGQVMVHG